MSVRGFVRLLGAVVIFFVSVVFGTIGGCLVAQRQAPPEYSDWSPFEYPGGQRLIDAGARLGAVLGLIVGGIYVVWTVLKMLRRSDE